MARLAALAFGFLIIIVMLFGLNRDDKIIEEINLETEVATPLVQKTQLKNQSLPTPQEVEEQIQNSSLFGTEIFRASVYLENGILMLNGHVLFYFDYFLSLQGEMDIDDIRKLIFQDMLSFYHEPIASLLFDVFERYILYLEDMSEHTDPEKLSNAVANIHELKKDLRQRHFTQLEIQQLFSEQEFLLSGESKARKTQKDFIHFREVTQSSPEQIEAIATEYFGEEAAQRLANTQQKKEKWKQDLRDYQCEKEAILNHPDLDDYSRKEGLNLLLERRFTAAEQRRIKALEQANLIDPC